MAQSQSNSEKRKPNKMVSPNVVANQYLDNPMVLMAELASGTDGEEFYEEE